MTKLQRPLLSISIPEIVAGLHELLPYTHYDIPEQPFSALYSIESDETRISIKDRSILALPGDIVVMPRGTAHSIYLANTKCRQRQSLQPPFQNSERRHDVHASVFCCRVPTSANPLPDVVPDVMLLSPESQRASGRLDLIMALLRHHALNANQDRQFMLQRLAEMAATIFLEDALSKMKSRGIDLEQALDTPGLRRAINAIHADPAKPWSLEDLARVAGVSRSILADRFKSQLGISPMAYLADHRLGYAARLLTESEDSILQIAARVGYETDSAFSKAFRKKFGITPSSYRRMPITAPI